jgi:hypothetical protein
MPLRIAAMGLKLLQCICSLRAQTDAVDDPSTNLQFALKVRWMSGGAGVGRPFRNRSFGDWRLGKPMRGEVGSGYEKVCTSIVTDCLGP